MSNPAVQSITPHEGKQGENLKARIKRDRFEHTVDVYLGPGINVKWIVIGDGDIDSELDIDKDALQVTRPVVVITTNGYSAGPATFTVK